MAAHRFWWAAICVFGSRLRASVDGGRLGLCWGPGGAVVANYSL
ncbi:hypothetical protein HMPREF1978_00369 [Actinomyces graevenitzii F0530]|uniref:Uncharacterized protein n=1 Tax=Actinomyces graevenitzii F0530 TaxID=1321817 RepID=U1RGX4_9ACTO|nr:hypothetical protein HMPREF1978_00369 [Actinomyces graevenitzii F0530]